MKIRELRNKITDSLLEIYENEDALMITEWLITDVMNIEGRFVLINTLNEEIDYHSKTYKVIKQKWNRLLRNEPIQYVLHKAWFYGLEFYVNRFTLIPRPETEEMCYEIIQSFKSKLNLSFVDIGTGSGCISIVLKKYFPQWNAIATDISADALKIAKCNALKHNVDIEFLKDDIFCSKLNKYKFDILISNPPYIPQSEYKIMKKNVTDFEPHIALFTSNENPLLFYEAILKIADEILNKNGQIFLELHENYANKVVKLFELNMYKVKLYKDMKNKQRFLMAKRI